MFNGNTILKPVLQIQITQYKKCTLNTVTVQNMTRTTVTIHVHVPLSQYKTCTHTTVTIQNMYTVTR